MKLLIVLSVIACGYAAKLDRTYLPPANAGTAGGSPDSLNTPLASSAFGQPAGFGQGRSLGAAGKPFGASGNTGFSVPSSQYGQPGSTQLGSSGQSVGPNFDAGFAAPAQNYGNQAQDYQRNQPTRAQAAAEKSAEILRYDNQNDGETFNYSFETSNGISAEESGVATNGVQAQGAFAYSGDDGQVYRVAYTADENGYQPQGDHLPTPPPIPEEIVKSIEENARAAAAGTQEGAYNPNEDNDESSNQQYNPNASTSSNYGAPNAPRPQAGAQSYQQSPSSQYGAPNAGSARSLNGFGQAQTKPSQVYGSPANGGGLSGPITAERPTSFSQPQEPQQYTSSASSTPNFGSPSQARPKQYQPSPSGQFPSAGRNQGSGSVQAQDASGYQYDKPQGGFGGNAINVPSVQSNQQFRPQGGAPATPQGYSRPSGNNGFPAAPTGQGSFGGAPKPKSQSFGSAPSTGSYGSAPGSQGSYTAAGPSSSSISSASSGPKSSNSFGANSQGSFGSPARSNSAFGAPAGSQPSFRGSSTGFSRPQGQRQLPGAKTQMPDNGYEYNRPSSQFGGAPQPQGGNQFGGPQTGNAYGGSPQSDFKSAGQGRPGQSFGAPRAPPSFSEEEGYKY